MFILREEDTSVYQKIIVWNKKISPNVPADIYDKDGYVLKNNKYGQNTIFEDAADAIQAIKDGLYKASDKYIYTAYGQIIGFNDINDDLAPWNYMDE